MGQISKKSGCFEKSRDFKHYTLKNLRFYKKKLPLDLPVKKPWINYITFDFISKRGQLKHNIIIM